MKASAYEALCPPYEVARLYTNFFQPSVKLVFEERVGSKVKKKYDQAKTPYQRTLESEQVGEQSKGRLRQQYAMLNPVALLHQMQRLQAVLWKLAVSASAEQEPAHSGSS